MKMNTILNSIKKKSPEILVGVGIVGMVVGTVVACERTTKLHDILKDAKENIDQIKECIDDEKLVDVYSKEDGQKDLALVYVQTGIKVASLYVPVVALSGASIACILKGTDILRKRNIALAAAYTVVDQSFKKYRDQVVEKFGNEIDKELRYGIKAKTFKETLVDEKTGEEQSVDKTVDISTLEGYSDYARFFDDGCNGWVKDAEYNLSFLRAQQQYANDLLQARGHLFLNEVYDMLGIPRSKAGQVVGWVYNEKNPVGDNFVDFGVYDSNREKARDFVNGYERAILLDFNVDGYIWELM